MEIEIWTPSEEFYGKYLISSYGRIQSTFRARKILTPKIDKDGYHEYGLRKDNKTHYKRCHRLVADIYIPNPLNLPVVNHLDGVKDNNYFRNLEWSTVANNTIHAYKNLIEKKSRGLSDLSQNDILALVEDYKAGKDYHQLLELYQLTCEPESIGSLLSGRRFSEITGIATDIRRQESKFWSKISKDIVEEILEDYFINGETQKYCAQKFNLSATQIHRITRGDRWTEVYENFKMRLDEKTKTRDNI